MSKNAGKTVSKDGGFEKQVRDLLRTMADPATLAIFSEKCDLYEDCGLCPIEMSTKDDEMCPVLMAIENGTEFAKSVGCLVTDHAAAAMKLLKTKHPVRIEDEPDGDVDYGDVDYGDEFEPGECEKWVNEIEAVTERLETVGLKEDAETRKLICEMVEYIAELFEKGGVDGYEIRITRDVGKDGANK